MTDLALQQPIRRFLAALGLDALLPPEQLDLGLAEIESQLLRVAIDAHDAAAHRTPLAEAATDFANFPHLARFHAGIEDVLTMSLPPPLRAWIERMIATEEPPELEGMRTALVEAAANAEPVLLRALARVALFEGVRLNLVLMSKLHPEETVGLGLDPADLDRLAEQQVSQWLSTGPAAPAGVRPLQLIVASAMERLSARAGELRAGLALMQRDFVEDAQQRAEVESLLAEMDVRDALLIRNEAAPLLGEQQLTVEHLQERHQLVLGGVSRNALDQRWKRARRKGPHALRRKRISIFDLVRIRAQGGGER